MPLKRSRFSNWSHEDAIALLIEREGPLVEILHQGREEVRGSGKIAEAIRRSRPLRPAVEQGEAPTYLARGVCSQELPKGKEG